LGLWAKGEQVMFGDNYLYMTDNGKAVVDDSLKLMKSMPDNSVNLVITSPPFALQRQKEYGNKDQNEYISWIQNKVTRLP